MDEQQFGWAVLSFLLSLLVSYAAKIPHHEAAVGSAGGEDSLCMRTPPNLKHLLGVVLQAMKGRVQVPNVMKSDRLVRRPCDQNILVERVERQAVDLSGVGLDSFGNTCTRCPGVPDDKLLVISNRPEKVAVLAVPGHVLNDASMVMVNLHGIQCPASFCDACDVPQTNVGVVTATQQVALLKGVPGQAVALCLVALQAKVRVAATVHLRLRRMFCVVKHKHVCADSLRGNNAGVLGHVPGPVDLAVVIDLLLDCKLACR
mmetsp:Transcript_34088/g.96627  ORF Transcript_34088/g.96627 Transcript_34088/m.96627 type:complete len:260 (+) Transcript_34088:498-1277(+)